MPYTHLTRNKEAVYDALTIMDGQLVAKKPVKIVFPSHFEEKHLASISSDVYVCGIFAIIVDNHYATNVMLSKVRLFPNEIEKVKYNETEYYELYFEKGTTIVENMNLVKENTIGYYVYDYLIAQGKVPWYIGALDLLTLFSKSNYYSGVNYGSNHVATELIAAMIMRNSNDLNEYWRHTVNSMDDINRKPPEYIPLRNVMLGARNTTAKLMGAYFNDGLLSALIYPSEKTETVEELLRQ